MKKKYLVTGGAGFIGSNFILSVRGKGNAGIVNLDVLNYAGNPENLKSLKDDPEYVFVKGDINDREVLRKIFNEYKPAAVVNFAAETHVDRSIISPENFIRNNVLGTFNLVDETAVYWRALPLKEKESFRYIQISTDEVYGALDKDEHPFSEKSPYNPKNPYSASKASADFIVRSYYNTYGLPVIITNTCNNFGPYQFPEKLIPLTIINAIEFNPIPVYGDGMQVRDWIYVRDNTAAIERVLEFGKPGESYNIGASSEKTNIAVVKNICGILDNLYPDTSGRKYESLIKYVADRPGHDRRYGINNEKVSIETGWVPEFSFEKALETTVKWYIENSEWIESVKTGDYRKWVETNYGKRI